MGCICFNYTSKCTGKFSFVRLTSSLFCWFWCLFGRKIIFVHCRQFIFTRRRWEEVGRVRENTIQMLSDLIRTFFQFLTSRNELEVDFLKISYHQRTAWLGGQWGGLKLFVLVTMDQTEQSVIKILSILSGNCKIYILWIILCLVNSVTWTVKCCTVHLPVFNNNTFSKLMIFLQHRMLFSY